MKVLCSGLNVVDLLVSTPENINFGQKNECETILMQGGAPAGNAACALASLGHETYFLGYFGNNPLSIVAKEELSKHGVKNQWFLHKEKATPAIATVQIDKEGERTVLYSTQNYVPCCPTEINKEDFKDFELILVDGYDTEINIHLLQLAKELGIETVLDLESAAPEVMIKMLKLCTHAILPLEAAQKIASKQDTLKALSRVSELTDAQVLITDGANGSFAMDQEKNSLVQQEAFKVKVVDTTGCGDSFHAAYASALLQGFNLQERMCYASFYASQVAQHFGGRTYLPNREFMEQNSPLLINS